MQRAQASRLAEPQPQTERRVLAQMVRRQDPKERSEQEGQVLSLRVPEQRAQQVSQRRAELRDVAPAGPQPLPSSE
jgi:hypothetical protein